jgi:hypothetical protein
LPPMARSSRAIALSIVSPPVARSSRTMTILTTESRVLAAWYQSNGPDPGLFQQPGRVTVRAAKSNSRRHLSAVAGTPATLSTPSNSIVRAITFASS